MPSPASPPISITLFTIYNYTICSQLTETELLYNCSITNWLGNLGNQRNLFDLLWTLKPVLLSKDINWWYCFFQRYWLEMLFFSKTSTGDIVFFQRHQLVILFFWKTSSSDIVFHMNTLYLWQAGWLRDHLSRRNVNNPDQHLDH